MRYIGVAGPFQFGSREANESSYPKYRWS